MMKVEAVSAALETRLILKHIIAHQSSLHSDGVKASSIVITISLNQLYAFTVSLDVGVAPAPKLICMLPFYFQGEEEIGVADGGD
jgi:hypothetical protein